MSTTQHNTTPREVHALLATFSTVMLGTYEHANHRALLVARPMAVAQLLEDCSLYFVSAVSSIMFADIASEPHGTIVAQSASRFVTLHGRFRISGDQHLLERVWAKRFDAWFDGPTDPRACILIFQPTDAEIWEGSAAAGKRCVFAAAKVLHTESRHEHA